MNLFKTLTVAATALALTIGAAGAADKLRIGTEGAYPPFNSFDSAGNLIGFDIDIANALCKEANYDCTFVAQDWDGIIPALIANKYDAIIASMSITEERALKVDFTGAYYTTPARFIADKKSGITDTSPAALKGKSIGVQSSTIHANYVEAIYPGSTMKAYATQDEANLDLSSGRLDLVMADSAVLLDWINQDSGSCCEYVGPAYNDPKYHGKGAGIAVRKGDSEVASRLEAAIVAIHANGIYKTINDKYFPFSVWPR